MKIQKKEINVPADVPKNMWEEYIKNFQELTHGTGKLMLFAGDQKIEHLNDDFYGESSSGKIADDNNTPEHLFNIASKAKISCLAVQYGLAARYGLRYKKVPLLIKMNSKTHLIKKEDKDPISNKLWTIEDVMKLKKNGLNVLGIGYTIYIGSEFEYIMLKEAAQLISEAHNYGLITVLWIYPRGKSIKDEKDAHLIAGATGVACCLGSDFVKVNYPKKEGAKSEEIFKEAVLAAGTTGVVCAGGSSTDAKVFLERLWKQINVSGAVGNATGRNIHQKPLDEAVRMCNAISAITFENKSIEDAMKIYKK